MNRLPKLLENFDKSASLLSKAHLTPYQGTKNTVKNKNRFNLISYFLILIGIIIGSWLTALII